jgi:hypothetical protein
MEHNKKPEPKKAGSKYQKPEEEMEKEQRVVKLRRVLKFSGLT